jgi:hypothetical protein
MVASAYPHGVQPMDTHTAACAITQDQIARLWDQCLADCLTRLALDPEQRQQVACHQQTAATWTDQQLAHFLRETEATIWSADRPAIAQHGKVWVACCIVAQVELGRRLSVWPPTLETLDATTTLVPYA